MEMKKYKQRIDDYFYAISEIGEGVPVIFLHGFLGDSTIWYDTMKQLSSMYRCIAIDLLGHGQSMIPERPVSIDETVHHLYQLLREKNALNSIIVGYSLGGRVALSYAAAHEDHVRGLILESSSPGIEDTYEQEKRVQLDDQWIKMIETDFQSFITYWENLELFSSLKAQPISVQSEVRALRMSQSSTGMIRSLQGMGTGRMHAIWNEWAELCIPTYLFVGAKDWKYKNIANSMKERNNFGIIIEFPNVGHQVHTEAKELFQQTLIRCLQSVINGEEDFR